MLPETTSRNGLPFLIPTVESAPALAVESMRKSLRGMAEGVDSGEGGVFMTVQGLVTLDDSRTTRFVRVMP